MKNGRVLGVWGCSLALGLAVFTGLNLPSSGFGLSAPPRSTATDAVPADGDGEKGELRVTVKSLLDTVLSRQLAGRAAPRSFNNDIGLPLAILAARPDDEYLVLEIGANNPGEIGQLTKIARPDIGVITMIGRAHLRGFGSIETVTAEKATMLQYLQGRQLAVVNADAPGLRRHLHHAEKVVLFGEAADADLRLTHWTARGTGGRLTVNDRTQFDLGLPGRHNAVNTLAVVAVARQVGLDDRDIAEALAACSPVAMRMSRHVVGDVTFYNDAYNANPDSTAASLESFVHLAADAPRRVLVLGDMLELGHDAAEQHREVGRRVIELDRQLHIEVRKNQKGGVQIFIKLS